MMRFTPGTTIVTREVWRGEVWAVRPMRVVADEEHLALWFPRGTSWLHPAAIGGGRIRVPTEPWELRAAAWHLDDNLILVRDGDAHAVHLFFDATGAQRGWYVNLQEPMRRTAIGFDFMDQQLDIVASADLTTVEWKDEDDFAALIPLIGDAAATEIRAEGERVIERMRRRAWPFDGSFDGWRADAAWPTPELTDRWSGAPAWASAHEHQEER